MSDKNIFERVLDDAKGVEEELLGPDYPYYKYIKTPSELGMSKNGDLQTLGKDIDGLISYVEVLVAGNSKASATGGPLGNKFFLQTGGKCKDVKSQQTVDRYIYIDNVPEGNIPLISQGLGVNFSEFKGLMPGILSNLNAFNPFQIMQAFMAGGTPDCQELTMETIDVYNNKSTQTHFVTLVDIKNMDPCSFSDKKNPLTGQSCKETFSNMDYENNNNNNNKNNKKIYNLPTIPDDTFVKIYFASLGMLGIYILYNLMIKMKMKK